MAPNPLTGVRYWLSQDLEHTFVYLDFKENYYSFNSGTLESYKELIFEESEILVGPKAIVEWSKE